MKLYPIEVHLEHARAAARWRDFVMWAAIRAVIFVGLDLVAWHDHEITVYFYVACTFLHLPTTERS